jgi:TM2 domain-containing membrane protein YozV
MPDNSNSDKNYKKPITENQSKDDVDQLKEELEKAGEKIEKMTERIIEQQKTAISLSKSKNEGIVLVLSIIVGLMGIMGVGHIYLGRARRGVIILILGIMSWVAFFIPFAILGVLGELEEEPSDPAIIIGMIGGLAAVGIGVFILFIWQVFDSRKLCREYNEYLEKNENPPW